MLDVFPTDQRDQIRVMVSESLRGIISQQLVPRADNTGRCLAMEILMNNPAVGNLIREGKTFMLPGVIQTGKKQGMQLMDDSILQLCEAGFVSVEEAMYRQKQDTYETSTGDEIVVAYIDHFFQVLLTSGGSDLHLAQGQPPKIRRHGEILPIREELLTYEEMSFMLSEICPAARWQKYEDNGDLDFAYEMDETNRFRFTFQTDQRLRRSVPKYPHHDHDFRRPWGSGDRQEFRRNAWRHRPGHRPHGFRKEHDARRADRLHQHQLFTPHCHDRRADRVCSP